MLHEKSTRSPRTGRRPVVPETELQMLIATIAGIAVLGALGLLKGARFSWQSLLTTLIIAILFNCACLLLQRRCYAVAAVDWALRLGNLLWLSLAIWFTGGAGSPFLLSYAVYITVAGTRRGQRGASLAYVLSCLAIAIMAFAERPLSTTDTLAAVIQIGILGLITIAAGALGQNRLNIEQELVATLAEAAAGRDRLAAVLNSATDGIVVTNREGRIELVNPVAERLWETSAADLAGKDVLEVIRTRAVSSPSAEGDLPGWLMENATQLLSQEQFPLRLVLELGVSEPRTIEHVLTVMHDSTGRAVGLIVVLHDQTEARELQQLRQRFFDTVVHDLRAPLSSILGAVEMLEGNDDPAFQAEMIQVVEGGAQRLRNLAETMLDLRQLEEGNLPLTL
ncbi:MAG TPA: PAS domain-containing protein, partial [Anaerolineae bacterium]|nr:PAS domain-containing protein [Anaerolineae bacterium]